MFKGLLTGGFFGLLIGGIGVIVASLAADQPAGNAPPAPPQVDVAEAGVGPDVADTAPEEPTVVADGTDINAAPLVVAPLAEPSAPIADTDPLALPQTAAVEGALDAPDPVALPDIAADAEAPVLPNPQSVAPQIPEAEGDIVVSTAPAAPVTPEPVVVVDETVTDVEAPADSTAEPVAAAEVAEAVSPTLPEEADPAQGEAVAVAVAPQAEIVTPVEEVSAEAADVAVVVDSVTVVPAEETAVAETEPAVVAGEAADVAPVAEAAETVVAAPETETVTPDPAEDSAPVATTDVVTAEPSAETAEVVAVTEAPTPEVVEEPAQEVAVAVETPAPEVGEDPVAEGPVIDPETPATPEAANPPVVVSIIDRDSTASVLPTGNTGVRVNRRIGTTAEPTTPEAAPEAAPVNPNAPAIERFAAPADNPEGKPLMAIVLLDDGTAPTAETALAALPFGVTVALDPTTPDVAARMATYRAAGLEVAMKSALPAGATPVDVEVALQAGFDLLPEVVLVIDAAEDGNTSGAITEQIVAAVAENGMGFVTASQGLNTGLRAAETAGVPASDVFRDLDSDGQDARVIRRFLDQAAFRARNGGGVVLLGRVRGETLDALAQWGDANRAGQVAMVPATAVLMAE